MEASSITCPRCHHSFPLTAAIEQPILHKAREQLEKQRAQIEADARKSAVEEFTRNMQELQARLAAKEKKLVEAQQAELKLIKERADFEEQKKAFELEVARRTEAVKESVARAKDEEFRLKEMETARKMDEMKRQIDELKRKAEQGSQQTQGEVLEVDLEGRLKRCFEEDEVVEVAKGAHGGDVLQHVRNERGHDCGTIIWECKRTKAWRDDWITKLKDDKLAAKAQIAVIVTTALPKEVATFECRDGVWITTPALAMALAAALRLSLIDVAAARRSMEGRDEKIELMYDYISGPQFQGRVQAIMEDLKVMLEELETEKKVIQKVWAKRLKQIERVTFAAIGMYGDLEGIIGKSLPKIDNLELPALDDESPEDESDPHFRFKSLNR
ncbi:MAG TPA: DUF2130 domain-containing protein [Tepidisphaeraceae bacterium]|jgi:hypothetical protein|nr:DUF2130 domain-containing protein [Tepidisphaeraceae bacterium]